MYTNDVNCSSEQEVNKHLSEDAVYEIVGPRCLTSSRVIVLDESTHGSVYRS